MTSRANLGGADNGTLNPRSEERGIRLVDPQLWPPVSDRDRYWFLGVKVEYRDHGAQITHVERRSPAHRSGLEVRDVIVNVAGYQVGKVNGRLYLLERELGLRADRRGNVGLLVHNHRNGELALLPVRLEPIERRRDPTVARPLIGDYPFPTNHFLSIECCVAGPLVGCN